MNDRVMQKNVGRVRAKGRHDTPDRVQAQFAARMGKAQARIGEVLVAMIKQFMVDGSHAHLLAQFGFGQEFQELNPRVSKSSQQSQHNIPKISIEASDIVNEDAELSRGFSYNSKRRRIVNREAGMAPCTISFKARSKSELTLMENAIKKILGSFVHRLYNGVLQNREENWQICFAKTLEIQTATEEMPQNAQGSDENYYVSEMSFEVYYEALHIEERIKTDAVVVPGENPLRIIDSGISNKVYLGERRNYMVQTDRPLLTYYLEDASLGRLFLSDDGQRITLIALKPGSTLLVVKNNREHASTKIEVVK